MHVCVCLCLCVFCASRSRGWVGVWVAPVEEPYSWQQARFETWPHKGLRNQGIVAKNTDNQLWLLHKLPYFLIYSGFPSFAPVSFHLFHHVCLKLSRISDVDDDRNVQLQCSQRKICIPKHVILEDMMSGVYRGLFGQINISPIYCQVWFCSTPVSQLHFFSRLSLDSLQISLTDPWTVTMQ